jgi:hypothetical protein
MVEFIGENGSALDLFVEQVLLSRIEKGGNGDA